jgi:hypothetical protein
MSDTSCAVFERMDLALDPTLIHRFVVGADAAPVPMTPADAQGTLGDAFATLLLLQNTFPKTAIGVVDAIKAAVPDGDPLRTHMSFVLGEGSHIAFDQRSDQLDRGLRFVVTLGSDANGPPDGPDILISASSPEQTDIELMAWDHQRGGFNFYRSMGNPPAWVFAGNAHDALSGDTQGKGPFESHRSGALLMKELKFPWVHWDSPKAHVFASAFGPGDARAKHEWFTKKAPDGAYTFEFGVAIAAIQRWAKARFDRLLPNGSGTIADPARVMAQILTTSTCNLVSSNRESRTSGPAAPPIDLPRTFFVDVDGLSDVGLEPPPKFEVPNAMYQATLATFDVRLDDENGFSRPGDTHFAFVVPERAFEDLVVLREAKKRGLVTRRLAACLLMTDFANPIFSERRAELMRQVPLEAVVENGKSAFSQELADAIVGAAAADPPGSPASAFAELWSLGADFENEFNSILGSYYEAIAERLGEQAGFDDYFRLAESRRRQGIDELPIFGEFKLLFARTSIPTDTRLDMRSDGSVVQR